MESRKQTFWFKNIVISYRRGIDLCRNLEHIAVADSQRLAWRAPGVVFNDWQ